MPDPSAQSFDLWTQVAAAYSQLADSVEGGESAPERLPGHLAFRLSRTFAQFDRREEQFLRELLNVISPNSHDGSIDSADVAQIFQDQYTNKTFKNAPIYGDRDHHRRRVRPLPFEAAVETVRRLVTVNNIREQSRGLGLGAILGGSVSYGRFYNTKGKIDDPSDLDLLVVVDDFDAGIANIARSLAKVPGVRSQVAEDIDRRRLDISLIRHEQHPCLISHQFKIWDGLENDPLMLGARIGQDFNVQLHIFDRLSFAHMIGDDYPTFMNEEVDNKTHWITDIRNDSPKRGSSSKDQCFAASTMSFDRLIREKSGRFLVDETCFSVLGARFYPGIFHGLLIPQFEVRWDDTDMNLRLAVTRYKNKLLDRLQYERVLRPWEDQTVAYAHVRHMNFNPHVWRKILNSSGDL